MCANCQVFRLKLFFRLAFTVASAACLIFAPFIVLRFPSSLLQVFARMFPFGRGLFEDKVANFWCATNVVYKWRQSHTLHERLPVIALFATVLGILPSFCHILYVSWKSPMPATESKNNAPSPRTTWRSLAQIDRIDPSPASHLLPLALFNCAMAFFLFSFQVHEKSILLPLMPLTIFMGAREDLGSHHVGIWEWGMLFNNVAVFRCRLNFELTVFFTNDTVTRSMWPLLSRDGQTLQYAVLTLVWNYLVGYNPFEIPPSMVKLVSLVRFSLGMLLHCNSQITLVCLRSD